MPPKPPAAKVTMLDVAEQCGVSYQTVSRVINNSSGVSAKTRRQVLKAIEALGYHPNHFARGLKTHRSYVLEVITFGVETHIPRELIVALGRAAQSTGYSLVFTDIRSDDQEEENRVLSNINSGLCDGAIVSSPVENRLYDEISTNPPAIPLVHIRNQPDSNLPSVRIDQTAGERLATGHLLEMGHRQIAEISGPLKFHEARARHESFLATLAAHQLAPAACVEAKEWMPSDGYEAAKELLALNVPFTALVVSNDYLALGAILALTEHGLRVPEDISVIGFDDAPESAYFIPPLTTVRQDYEALGQQSIQYLIDLINNPETSVHQRVLAPRLIKRKSVRSIV